ncbi:D-aspartate oxidase-like isoform X1 [Anopheles stephensi]|uniref:D-aspartate oxidase-like isoform X1 n=1 Tax=Anopheles stephensi TaxID=30069 RepID=UPI00165892CD|nr:D-aspartate oxidase-like isoform X1 [Anopheles stephensi]XP_035918995.1 D-aspartate oxidase-like isoform X1 [Anopheles stephensi]
MSTEHYQFVILGGGINGLSCAIRLSNEFPCSTIQIISDNFSPNTTSDVAAGLWGPYALGGTSTTECRRWAQQTHDYFLQLWRGGYADRCGICLVPVLELYETDTTVPWWHDIVFGFSKTKFLKPDDTNNHQDSFYTAFSYITFTCEPSKIMKHYREVLSTRNVTLRQEHLTSLRSLENMIIHPNAIIINCLGLGSQSVFKDADLFPLRGQVQKVKAEFVFHSYANESCYIIPNTDTVILGGTKQKHHNLQVNPIDRYDIRAQCLTVLPALRSAVNVKDFVGLRPVRSSGVRLEVDHAVFANGEIHVIIHNYGHGGAGITLAWGCAGEVTRFVQEYGVDTSKCMYHKL